MIMAHDHSHSHGDGHNHLHGHGHSSHSKEESKKQTKSQDAELLAISRRLLVASILCSLFFLVEAIGGYLAHSLAILSDAAHLFSDLTAFIVALAANHLAQQPSTAYHTFGLRRSESLAALFSMVTLAFACSGLGIESVRRLWGMVGIMMEEEKETQSETDSMFRGIYEVDGKLMSLIAGIGVIVNVLLAFILGEHHVHLPGGGGHDHSHDHGGGCDGGHSHGHKHSAEGKSHDHEHGHSTKSSHDHSHNHGESSKDCHEHGHHHKTENDPLLGTKATSSSDHPKKKKKNVNLHAVYLHVLGDLLQSVVVFITGLFLWWKPEWALLDPILTLVFSVFVLASTIPVIKQSILVLMEGVPEHLAWHDIHDALEKVHGVINIHDLHVWYISDGVPSLSVHVMMDPDKTTVRDAIQAIVCTCQEEFDIAHVTAQVQPVGQDETACVSCSVGHCSSNCASRPSSSFSPPKLNV